MLDEKDLGILRHVVDIHVREGVAVSSLRVKNVAGLGVSTATIRNAMARLERMGCLTKPHASAGRIPTDQGYRRYVDHLETETRYGDVFVTRLRDQLRDRPVDAAMVMACASRILGALSKNLAVVYGFVAEESVVRRLQIVPLEGTRLLVVVYLEPEREQTSVLQVGRRFSAAAVKSAERRLNQQLESATVSEAKEILRSAVRDNITEEGIIAREVAVQRENILSEAPAVELYFEERDHMMAQPELSDPRLLQMLLGLLHNKDYLTQVLSARVSEGTQVTIGHENADQQLQSFSLVTAGYRMGVARGTLGIIGPTRMRYDLVQALVGTAARELRALGEEYF